MKTKSKAIVIWLKYIIIPCIIIIIIAILNYFNLFR